MLSEVLEKGFEKVYEDDMESQVNYITTIAKDVREMEPDVIFDMNGVFIPNAEYMRYYWGVKIMEPRYDCYRSIDECNWSNCLIFPIRDILDNIVGIVGFNPINKLMGKENGEIRLNAYRHSSKSVFNKGLYFFTMKGILKRAIEEGYLIIVDGVFDSINCCGNGLLAAATLGSILSDEQKAILSFIKTIYVASDNDEAGLSLARQIKSAHKDVRVLKFNKFKDVDGVLKSEYKEEFLRNFHNERKLDIKRDMYFRF